MSKHSTTPHTLSRRLAALLAALALLAAMALPVYGEPQNEDTTGTTQAEAEIGGTISDGNVTPENDSTPPEENEMAEGNMANADGDNASENKETNADADDRSLDLEDADASDETYDTIQEDSSANFESSDYNQLQDANEAEESHITQISAAQTSDSSFNIYFAVPTEFATNNYTGVKLNYQKSDTSNNNGWPGMQDMRLLQSRDYSGRKVYEITISPGECPVYFQEVQFHYVNANGNIVEGDGKFEKLSGPQYRSNIANKLYDAESGTWENFTPYDPNNHQTFAGESMTFENLSNESLTNVKALFYEPDSANNDALTLVATVEIGNVDTNKRKPFAIPDAACSYIKFTAEGKDDLSDTYNFYGQGNASHFIYNENTQYCFTYRASDASAWGTSQQENTTVYFDATLSKLTYNKDKETEAKVPYGMPTADNELWYYAKFADGTTANGMMTQDGTNSNGNIWYVSFTGKTPVSIRFASWDVQNEVAAGNGDGTAMLTVPHNLEQPCFYADTSDAAVYEGGNRDGYWDELGQTRDAAKGKKSTVVDVESAAFTKDGKTKYISSTLYDYYSDWELNGKNRDTYNTNYNNETFANNRNWVTFRQFDQALSDYYRNSGATVNYPMYTGQFQPDAVKSNGEEWGIRFSAIASTLNLYGYANTDTKTFMAVNNSTSDINGNGLAANQTKLYDETFQGLAGSELKNGEPIMNGTTDLAMPFFNEEFLQSENSKKTKLGEVYKDVSFPFTQEEVFKESDDATAYEKGVKYWYFDSDKTTLYLKKDTGDEGYFLQRQSSLADNSKNLLSNSTHAQVNNKDTYGFFPFNSKSTDTKASTYNYGFGAKLQFQFTLTSDGKVKDDNGNEVPIKFFFSGDDDVWVYIDDKLALDVGGDHGKASGLLEFGADNNGNNYTSYVSDIKASNNTVYGPVADKAVTYLGNKIKFNYKSTKSTTLEPGTHTLTMYYMERGMWESNMAIAFNFPDNNELEVEKQVKVDGVNESFKKYFQNADLFGFTIKNLATHYGKQSASELLGTKELKVDKASWTAKPANKNQCEWEQTELGNISSTDAIHWFTGMTDANSDYRPQRYGVITPNSGTADISEMGYLTFKVYANTEFDDYLKLNDLYLELEDSSGHKWGSLNKAGLAGKTYNGISKLTKKNWVTVKIDLSKLTKAEDFDATKLKTIYIGDNRPVDLYIKDIQFTSKAEVKALAGFRTAQKDIPDYETAIGNTENVMKPAVGAQYTSNRGGSTQVVDEEGRFQLRDKEVITFKDQFRRGSYISVTEDANPDLYDTKWTIYENGQAVTTNNGGDTVSEGTLPLQDVTGYTPDDGRTEETSTAIGLEDDNSRNSYAGQKPKGEAIVFRSYSNPDANDTAELTKLRLQFVNTVKTGSIIIQKKGDNTVTSGKFQFKVTYTNVGGQNLEGENTIEETYDVTYGEPYEIKGIPIGTQFTIEEIESDGTYLQKVEVAKGDSAQVIKGKTVEGTVTKLESDSASVTATFTNTKHQLMDIDLIKNWQNASGQPMTADELETVPDTIYVKLQRRIVATLANPWTDVAYSSGSTLGYVEIKRDNGGWHYKFANLDATQWESTETPKPQYEYRVVEGKLEDGGFTPMGDDETTIVLDGKVYKVSGGDKTTTEDGKHTITLTNKLQDPEFNLDVIKKSAEDDTFLDGVEFTLEKMNDDGTAVDMSFDMRTGVTNSQGEIKAKNADGTAGDANIFHGLKAGIYRLTETKTKAGYSLLSEPIMIQFTQKGECLLNGVAANGNIFKPNPEDGSYTLTLTVLNRKTPALPHTGADAPSLWLLIGLPLAVAGLLILVFRYNKKGGRTR